MLKRIVTYSLVGLFGALLAVLTAGGVMKYVNRDRVAPGVILCGRDVSGMSAEELFRTVEGLVPETVTELRCRFLPEMRGEIEAYVRKINKEKSREELYLAVCGNELCLTVRTPVFRVNIEDTVKAVLETSRKVKVWEQLYKAVTGQTFRIKPVGAIFIREEAGFEIGVNTLREAVERERREATVAWEKGKISVTESLRGFRLDTEKLCSEAEHVLAEATERMNAGPVEGLVLRFYVNGTALMPRLSTTQAKKCDTIIGEFVTFYTGAGGGRVQNIEAGAEKLHARVILPGEEFSVATVLMPFTEANGYASGGTYIDGQLSKSIGGGVCQLSTTLYNALLQTRLDITMRYPHSMTVGYVPLGRDAAIAGDYKDLRFVNNTKAPVLLLCVATGECVKVTLYGAEEATRGEVSFESVVTEQDEESVTVEVYRVEKGEKGKDVRERVSRDKYKEK